MQLIHMSFAGPIVKLRQGKITHTFEMHSYCGPMRLLADGETGAKTFWPEKSKFWGVFDIWMKLGQKIDKWGYGVVE